MITSVLSIQEFNPSSISLRNGGTKLSSTSSQDLELQALNAIYTQKIERFEVLWNQFTKHEVDVFKLFSEVKEHYREIYTATDLYIELKNCYAEVKEIPEWLKGFFSFLQKIESAVDILPASPQEAEVNEKAIITVFTRTLQNIFTSVENPNTDALSAVDIMATICNLEVDPSVKSLLLSMSSAMVTSADEKVTLFHEAFESFARTGDLPQMLQCSVELMKLGRYEEALSLFEQAKTVFTIDEEMAANIGIDQGICLMRQEKHQEALEKFQEANQLSTKQKNIISLTKLECYESSHRMEDAREDYEVIKDATFNDLNLVLQQAKYILYFENNRKASLEKLFPFLSSIETIDIADLDADSLYIRGMEYCSRLKFEQGIKCFKSALEKDLPVSLLLTPNSPSSNHILQIAIHKRDTELVQKVFSSIAGMISDFVHPDEEYPPLYFAANDKVTEIPELLFNHAKNPFSTFGSDNHTIVHEAIIKGNYNFLKFISSKANGTLDHSLECSISETIDFAIRFHGVNPRLIEEPLKSLNYDLSFLPSLLGEDSTES